MKKKIHNPRVAARLRRKIGIRKRVHGNVERPRMTVFRSNKHIYVQVIDDEAGQTLVAASTLSSQIAEELGGLKKSAAAKKVGELAARLCLEKAITSVVFDRNGYIYHGRISAVAEGAREAGLNF